MGEVSGIAWTHATFNAWIGCARVSPACENCYAERLAKAKFEGPPGKKLPLWGVDAARRPMSEDYWRAPLRWNRKAEATRERRRVFSSSLADVFEVLPTRNEGAAAVVAEGRRRLFALIRETPWLDWLLLTKRIERVAELVPAAWMANGFPHNVWIGTTAEDQKRANERVPHLLKLPAVVRFVSHEPAIEAVDFTPWLRRRHESDGIDWLITGGESGPNARTYDLAWARDIIRQSEGTAAAPFVKQLGAQPVESQLHIMGRLPRNLIVPPIALKLSDKAGADPTEWPEDLRRQIFPVPRVAA